MGNSKNRHVARTIEALKKSSGMAGSESVRYVALGDSVTLGWLEHGVLDAEAAYPALLRRKLSALYPFAVVNAINMGLGGENAEGALARFERDVARHDPHLVTVCLGLNDARQGKDGVEAFKANLIRRRTRGATRSRTTGRSPSTSGRSGRSRAKRRSDWRTSTRSIRARSAWARLRRTSCPIAFRIPRARGTRSSRTR